MKKTFLIMFAMLLCFGLSACENSDSGEGIAKQEETSPSVKIVSEKVIKYIDSIDELNVIYLAEIKNIGKMAVNFDDVSIDLENTEGKIINSTSLVSTYPNIINPGESTYVCESLIGFAEEINPDEVGKAILHYEATEHELLFSPNVSITEIATKETFGHTSFVGRVENLSDKDITNLYIISPIRDATGELQTVGFTIVDLLKAKEKKGIELNIIFGDSTSDFSQSVLSPFTYIE